MLTHHYVALLVTAFIQISLALFVYLRGPKRLTNITYALYSASIAHWSFFEALGITATDEATALFLWRLNHVGVIFITIFFVHFMTSLYPRTEQLKTKRLIFISYLVGFAFLILNFSGILIQKVQPKFYFKFFINANPFYYPFFFLWIAWAVYGLVKLFKLYQVSSPTQKRQLRYFSLSMFIAYLGGIPNFLPTFNILVPYLIPFGTYAIAVYGFFTVYAIVKYHLLDIRVLAIRTFVFVVVYLPILSLPVFAGIYYKNQIQSVFHENWWIIPVVMQIILAPLGLYFYSRIKSRAEDMLMREQRDYQRMLLRISQGMILVKDLNKLAKLIVHILSKALKIKNVALFLLDKETHRYSIKTMRYKEQIDASLSFGEEDIIIRYLVMEKAPIVLEELKSRLHSDSVKNRPNIEVIEQMMEKLKMAVLVPSFVQDLLIGFLVLGEKANGQIYTKDDLNVFEVLANQSALAIENALFYEEQGKTLAEKFHEHKVWSIGKMGAGVGHQINNRFGALSANAETVLFTYLPKLKKLVSGTETNGLIEDIEDLLKRVTDNAKRGGEIAKTLTSFSRKSDEFKFVDIEEAIKGALNLLSCKFKIEELNLELDMPSQKPKIYGNLSMLQDIFFNMLDNTHDAEVRKKNEIEHGTLKVIGTYLPKTVIRAELTNNHLQIEIEDNGIGMTEEETKQLFIPFFTTKATSEKGTGLGLPMIKQMIDAQKGSIKITSKYGEGTKIMITLPIIKG